MGRIAVVAGVLLALAAPALHAQPRGDPRPAVEVEGATYAEFDEAAGRLTLRGNTVVVRRGAMTTRAPSIIYDTRQRTLRASGGVSVSDAALTIEAPEVTVWIDEERLQASGGVSAMAGQGPDALRMRAARLEVFGRDGRAVATGQAELISAQSAMTADTITVDLRRRRFAAAGRASLTLQADR